MDFKNVPKHFAPRTDGEMKEVLMDPGAPSPAVHYYMIRGGRDRKNITVWETGKVGEEYIKNYGHYHVGKLDETYWILWGEGIALLQKLATNGQGKIMNDVVEEFRAIKVKPVDEIYIPPGYGHLVANTGTTYLVAADNSPVDFEEINPVSSPRHADYEPVRKMRGFAYYVVESGGKPALKKNPLYREIKKEKLGGLTVII